MKLILRADVDTLGRLGDIVAVKPGYGRNYLIPQGLAMQATEANLKQFELERKKLAAQADALRAEATGLADKIAAATVVITVRVGEGDKLYGSVTAQNVADALAEQGIEIDRRKIELPEAIRALGEFEVEVHLHPGVTGTLKLRVIKHGQQETEPEQQPEA
ncbi:MAG: 50S ribosomal protein L9 [Desulfovibrio sp.]|nr:50S ribosomal protein L9 [Desulfovibrio sp.]